MSKGSKYKMQHEQRYTDRMETCYKKKIVSALVNDNSTLLSLFLK